MRESQTIADNVTNNFHRRDISLHIEGKYMRESHSIAGNVTNNFQRRENGERLPKKKPVPAA